ncbi:LIM/homeobox protein Lhx9-like [Cydia pomonella]|uniref:LIM/homeobox protein Lhx9-like n=1 Tax=Cydia pomonella TaxID=82600 RepID=UPI002ADD9D17|nr:LIM/homeobox protein Lhx9-like [Cydia pomonella]
MNSYFAVYQNPDAKDLKQKTGLSKIVLQVWFQNARAKWRRNIMRQETNPTPHSIQPPTLMLELQTLDENAHHPVPFTDMY